MERQLTKGFDVFIAPEARTVTSLILKPIHVLFSNTLSPSISLSFLRKTNRVRRRVLQNRQRVASPVGTHTNEFPQIDLLFFIAVKQQQGVWELLLCTKRWALC